MSFIRIPGNEPGLIVLEGLTELVSGTAEALVELGYILFSEKYRDEIARKKAQDLIRQLKIKGYIEMEKRGKRALYSLTDKGRVKILKHKISSCKLLPKGQYVVVIFDIPESQRSLRNEFRWSLKRNKFIQVQLSVWASQQRVYKEIKNLVFELGIEKWVTIFYAHDLSNELKQ